MFDIAEQLFPNIITIGVQLCATGVIYVLYKKYLHQPVLKLMDKKADDFQKEYHEIETLKKEQESSKIQFEHDKKEQMIFLENQRKKMLEEMNQLSMTLTQEAKYEAQLIQIQALKDIEKERLEMIRYVERHIIDLSSIMVGKVLEGYTFDEQQMVQALEKELKQSHVQS